MKDITTDTIFNMGDVYEVAATRNELLRLFARADVSPNTIDDRAPKVISEPLRIKQPTHHSCAEERSMTKLGKKASEDEWIHAQYLIAKGYRKTSNKYGIIARIDRPDWVEVLAASRMCGHHARTVADFYVPDTGEVAPHWEDTYRRGHSKDSIELGQGNATAALIPSSLGEVTGYTADGAETYTMPDKVYALVDYKAIHESLMFDVQQVETWRGRLESDQSAATRCVVDAVVSRLKKLYSTIQLVCPSLSLDKDLVAKVDQLKLWPSELPERKEA